MAAIKQDILMEQGATFFMEFVWTQDSLVTPGTPGDPVPLTGYTARMQVRKQQQSTVLVEALSTGPSPEIILGGLTGKFTIEIPDEKTNGLSSRRCKFDIEAIDPAGRVYRVMEGNVTVTPNITQDPGEPVVR